MKQILMLCFLFSSLASIYCTCGPNEEMNICGRTCEPSCKLRDFSAVSCIACSNSTRGCRCKKNFLRDEESQECVDAQNCSTCDYGESKEACGRTCEGTCAKPYQPEICNRIRCGTLLCRCDLTKDFVRNSEGKCVKKRDCYKYPGHY